MRVFVTGATGFVGSAVVQELLGAGHQVLGLVRSEESAKKLAATGAEVHRGALDDLDSLRRGAAAADGVIHTAFIHDFQDFAAASETDRQAIEAIGAGLAGSNRPFIVSTGLAHLPQGRLATEADVPQLAIGYPRRSEETALALVAQGIRAMVVRLSPTVHGAGDHGFIHTLITIARAKGEAAYLGDGSNRWPAVHRLDAAQLYRLALEQGAAGTRYHGVAEEGVPMRDIATIIGRHLGLPVVSKTADEAAGHFGWMARFVGLGMAASSTLTQQQLGWQPNHPTLLEDLEQGHYFES